MAPGREQTLKALHAAAAEIGAADSVEAACRRTVAAAEDTLEFDMCTLVLHDDGWLEPVATSSNAPEDGFRRMRTDQGLAGKTYQTGKPHVVDEIGPDDDTDPAREFYRSGMSVPVGDVGVFQAVSEAPSAFDDGDVEFVELLVAHAASAVDRIRSGAELQRRQEALTRQNERLAAFVDAVSHDLRNPLNVATGELDLASEECDSDHLDAVASQHDRMTTLIEDLLVLAREGSPIEEREVVDLGSVARSCWGHVATTDATLDVRTDLRFHADPGRLRQLLENLYRNAVEHGGDDVTVTVGTLARDVGFYVADDGPGVPAGGRETLFEKGYSTSVAGTGFGLAIVREIAEAHDWAVDVVESRDGGARFEVSGVDLA